MGPWWLSSVTRGKDSGSWWLPTVTRGKVVDPCVSPLSLEVRYWKVDKKATIKN